jgi:hypothetical protein
MKTRCLPFANDLRVQCQSVAKILDGFYLKYNFFLFLFYHMRPASEQDRLFLFYSAQTPLQLDYASKGKNHLANEKYPLLIFSLIFYQTFEN